MDTPRRVLFVVDWFIMFFFVCYIENHPPSIGSKLNEERGPPETCPPPPFTTDDTKKKKNAKTVAQSLLER